MIYNCSLLFNSWHENFCPVDGRIPIGFKLATFSDQRSSLGLTMMSSMGTSIRINKKSWVTSPNVLIFNHVSYLQYLPNLSRKQTIQSMTPSSVIHISSVLEAPRASGGSVVKPNLMTSRPNGEELRLSPKNEGFRIFVWIGKGINREGRSPSEFIMDTKFRNQVTKPSNWKLRRSKVEWKVHPATRIIAIIASSNSYSISIKSIHSTHLFSPNQPPFDFWPCRVPTPDCWKQSPIVIVHPRYRGRRA